MSGIGIAKGAKLFVIAGDESRTGMNSAANVDQPTVDAMVEFGHGIRFVNIGRRKQLQSKGAEHFLCSDKEAASVFATSGNVEQSDQNALGTYPNRVIKVSGDAFSNEYGSDICPFESRKDGGSRFGHLRGDR